MFNDNEFSIPQYTKAAIVSITNEKMLGHTTDAFTKESLEELKDLLRTLDVQVTSEHTQNRKLIDPATVIGLGKLEEIAIKAKEDGAKFLIFDFDLTASQVRNIKEITKLEVADRCFVILEIFAKHARTKEAKIQIEISKLEYTLPRLTSMWTHLSRQRGGVGVRGGEGEQQIELDRRMIRKKISQYKKQLEEIKVSRHEQNKKRQNRAVTAALVGYTNAGKSSLMNMLCKVNIRAEDKLFATLDSTYRTLNPETKPPMILIDTVGFISNLPSTLINGFKSTLASALEADLIIIVCDISSPHYKKHIEVTEEVLNDIGIKEKERMFVFTKKDKCTSLLEAKVIMRNYPHSFLVSTLDPNDMSNLRKIIIDYFLSKQDILDVFLPYSSGDLHSRVMANTNILNKGHHEKGIFYRLQAPRFILQNLGLQTFVLDPQDPLHQELEIGDY